MQTVAVGVDRRGQGQDAKDMELDESIAERQEKEKEGSRITPKTLFHCYLFLRVNRTCPEEELGPKFCVKNSD